MTDETASDLIFKATFSDFKVIKGRKVVQIVLEVPIENGDAALASLGGLPNPASEAWVGVARLSGSGGAKPPKPKRNLAEMSYAEQSALLCQDYAFRTFLRTLGGAASVRNQDDAAEFIRDYCGVNSRSDITHDSNAGRRWTDLLGEWHRYKTRTMQDE